MCDITPAGLVAAVPEVTQDFGYFRTLGTSAAPSGRARLTRSSTPTYGPAPASARCPVPNGWPGAGVLKRRLLFLYGRPWLSPVVRLIRPGLSGYTVVRYRLLARRVARQLIGYQRSGFDVVGVVGVDASPTCGVTTTLDLDQSLAAVVACPLARLDRRFMNDDTVLNGWAGPGRGLLIAALSDSLARRDGRVALLIHDLRSETPESSFVAGPEPAGAAGTHEARDGGGRTHRWTHPAASARRPHG
jgi:hypothetical protein